MVTDTTAPLSMKDTEVLTAVFKNLAVGVIVCDTDGHFVFFNPEAERILGIRSMHIDSEEWSSTYGCYLPDMETPYPPEELPLPGHAGGGSAPRIDLHPAPATAQPGALDRRQRNAVAGQFGHVLRCSCAFF